MADDIVERLRRRTFRPTRDMVQAFNEQGNLTNGDARLHEDAADEIERLRAANDAFGKRQDWWTERMFELEQERDSLRAALAAQQAPQAEPVAWRDHVEHRLRTWRQQTMNRSGDLLALDDYMNADTMDDLIDFVCDEWAKPERTDCGEAGHAEGRCGNASCMSTAPHAPAAPAGWQLVPVEPTPAMRNAAVQTICYGPEGGFTRIAGPDRCWAAMLAAAPTHTGDAP